MLHKYWNFMLSIKNKKYEIVKKIINLPLNSNY